MTETSATRKVFISYSYDDAEWVVAFSDALRARDLDVLSLDFLVSPGDTIQDALETGLRAADDLVFLISPDVASKPWMFFEFGVAAASGKRFIPIVPDDLDLTSFPVPMQSRRYVVRRSPEQTATELYGARSLTRTA